MLVGVPLAVCWLYCAVLLRNFFLVEELTLLPDVAPTTVKLKVNYLLSCACVLCVCVCV